MTALSFPEHSFHIKDDLIHAIQETVLKCWQKIEQLKSEEYFGTWLTRILINQCKDILKERKKGCST